ncbi:MAG TPA: hypothetical protein VFN62_08185 [Acidobacteriaceae bacterium]|nr:hypothetical protein [Acidobacteriaceae bacterium]
MIAEKSNPPELDSTATWGVKASYLIRLDQASSGKSDTLTTWINEYAKRAEQKASSLWRLLSAGRYYNELRSQFRRQHLVFPSLDDPRLAASPESLEIVRKISRVAPDEVVMKAQKDAMRGSISRRKLRELWITYRPVLEGRTARGRGVPEPRFDPRNAKMSLARWKADCVAEIRRKGPGWLQESGSHLYIVIPTANRPEFLGLETSLPDAFVLHCPTENHDIAIHGIWAEMDSPNLVSAIAPIVDWLWIAFRNRPRPVKMKQIPRKFGLLLAHPGEVVRLRQAAELQKGNPAREQLLRRLLKYSLHQR